MNLRAIPILLKKAGRFIADLHRHHKPPQGGKFAIGAMRRVAEARQLIRARRDRIELTDGDLGPCVPPCTMADVAAVAAEREPTAEQKGRAA